MKNNIIAFFVSISTLPMFGMHNTASDERMPKMITKFKKKYYDHRYQIHNKSKRQELLTLHTQAILLSEENAYPNNSLSEIETSLAQYVNEKKLVNNHFQSTGLHSMLRIDENHFLNRRSIVLNRHIS